MSESPSSQSARIPAWKRLGLKLVHENESKKRKIDKISSNENSTFKSSNGTIQRKKSVTFAQDTKVDDGSQSENLLNDYIATQQGQGEQFTSREANRYSNTSAHHSNGNNPSKSSKSDVASKDRPKSRDERITLSDEPTSEYLRYLVQFGTDRANWKFKKHDQILLLKYTFSERRIPSQYFETYLTYIDGLQGQARQRLAERAQAVVDEPEPEGDNEMEDVTSRDNARATAMKQQLLNTKIRLREGQDDRDLDDISYRAKYTKRRRAEEILKLLADVSAKHNIQIPYDKSSISTPSNQVINTKNGPKAAAKPGKRQRVRIKKARTGVPEDDLSSVSSVELGPAAKKAAASRKLVEGKQSEAAALSTDKVAESSSVTSDSSSDDSSSDSDDSSIDTDTDTDSSDSSSDS